MTAYIYLVNGKIHSVENITYIQHDYLNECTVFHVSNRLATMKYQDKDVLNISVQL